MTPILNLTTRKCIALLAAWCCAASAQTSIVQAQGRYPLRKPVQPVRSYPSPSVIQNFERPADLQIRELPPIDVPDSTNEFSATFNNAYQNLGPATENPAGSPRIASTYGLENENSPPPQPHEFSASGGEFAQYRGAGAIDPRQKLPPTIDWWQEKALSPIATTLTQQPVDTNSIVYETLRRSPRIQALSQNPLVRELQVVEADADFDPTSFVRSQFQDRVDPVGDNLSLTLDGSDFLEDHIWTGEFGIRRKMRTGATYELGQTLGFKNSNSSFFNPQDQGTATLALNVTQPLLRGSGRYYNQSQILIAQSAGGAAWNTFVAELQDEIQTSVTSYWRLYYNRSVYLQKQRNVERGEKVLRTLEGRRELDSLPSQITRARSAVQSRKTDLANARRDIRDSETEIRRITADRNWQANQSVELLPTEAPATNPVALELEHVVLTALENRPEIKEAMIRAKIAGIQRDVSVNELMPELSLLMGTYVSALKGDSQLGQAIQDQFGEVKPGYSVGIEFELPIRNRAARSRLAQRKLQLAKIRAEVDETMQNVVAESQISLRRITSAKETLDAAAQAIEAANADLEQNFRRWESFALIEGDIADGQTPTTILDQLLDSQERLTAAELVYTQSVLDLKTAEVALQRTMGTLLIHQNISFDETYNCDVPELHIHRGQAAPPQQPAINSGAQAIPTQLPQPAEIVPTQFSTQETSQPAAQYPVYPINDPTWDGN